MVAPLRLAIPPIVRSFAPGQVDVGESRARRIEDVDRRRLEAHRPEIGVRELELADRARLEDDAAELRPAEVEVVELDAPEPDVRPRGARRRQRPEPAARHERVPPDRIGDVEVRRVVVGEQRLSDP